MTCYCAPIKTISHNYFVVAIDYGRKGIEAIVDPEITRSAVITRIVTGEYDDIAFIHHIHDGSADDVTEELMEAAQQEMFARGMEVA